MTDTLSLSATFDTATEADWEAAATKALKGRGLEAITRDLPGGFTIRPLYREPDSHSSADPLGAPGTAPYLRGPTAEPDAHLPWDIRQAFTHGDPTTTNTEILRDLERGVSSIEIKLDCTGQTGCAITEVNDFDTALANVHADIATIALDHGAGTGTSAAALLALWAERQAEPKALKLAFNMDPLGALARTGYIGGGLETAFRRLTDLSDALRLRFPHATLLRMDGRVAHEAGASEAQELAALIAAAIDTLRRLDAAGLPPVQAASEMIFAVSLDANYAVGIAKLRAARRLWARVQEALGIDPQPMRLQAMSSGRMLTRYDPWVNMLRGTAACFAGATGGADIISVQPFNAALGTPEELGRRIARNTQIMAMEESNLGKVADPAGGAYTMETLANELAEAAWAEVQQIEREGGYAASLLSGGLQARIAEVRKERAEAIAKRKIPITGVTEFPLIDEIPAPVGEPAPNSGKSGVSSKGLDKLIGKPAAPGEDATCTPLTPIRLAASFETLRDAAAKASKPPAIFLATLGPLADHTARTDFATNLFAAGGIVAKSAPVPPQSTAECVAAFKASSAKLAVICGTDEAYAASAADLNSALKAAGAVRVYLAGKIEADGVDTHIFMGCDVLHALKLAHTELGINA